MLFNWFFRSIAKFVPAPKAPEIADIVAAIDLQALESRMIPALLAAEPLARIEKEVIAYTEDFYDRVEDKVLTTVAAKVRSLGFEEKAVTATVALLNVEQLHKEVVASVVDKIDPDEVIECATETVTEAVAGQLIQLGGISPTMIQDHVVGRLTDSFLEKHARVLKEVAQAEALALAEKQIDTIHDAMKRALGAVTESWR